ncbi:MAG TPA: hypothetical protein VIP05_21935 [Burkholderiaceae bacterium]
MTRRRISAGTSEAVEPPQDRVAGEAKCHDEFASRYLEWLRQVERIEATSLAGFGTLLQKIATRAASARTWAQWMELAGTGLQEAVDDAAKTQGEWLSAWMQCQMEAVKMLLDLGRPALEAGPSPGVDLPMAWWVPWMAGAGVRPIQIA